MPAAQICRQGGQQIRPFTSSAPHYLRTACVRQLEDLPAILRQRIPPVPRLPTHRARPQGHNCQSAGRRFRPHLQQAPTLHRTQVPTGWMPNTSYASSSFATHRSTYGMSSLITLLAVWLSQNFLRKFRSQLTVTPLSLATLSASMQMAGRFPPSAGVIPVK